MPIHRHFDDELFGLQVSLVHMAGIAEKMLRLAVREVTDRNENLSGELRNLEKRVNELHIEIDETAIRLLALHQPVASDLRLLVMSAKISSEIERIADQAVNISESGHYLLQHPPVGSMVDISALTRRVEVMVWDSVDAYVRKDADLARQVLGLDAGVDELNSKIFRDLIEFMKANPSQIQPALALVLIARNLEKIGDHATNIAEEVITIVLGEDVRHRHEKGKRKG
ncbi:MAG: phosphate signaling complex protein PhoU [Planctomycetota bacterium]|nr:phosphate signaling complex protein PhoU [Planctomycetota bacterium]